MIRLGANVSAGIVTLRQVKRDPSTALGMTRVGGRQDGNRVVTVQGPSTSSGRHPGVAVKLLLLGWGKLPNPRQPGVLAFRCFDLGHLGGNTPGDPVQHVGLAGLAARELADDAALVEDEDAVADAEGLLDLG